MRINLFAGPGAGKSTTAAWLFSELKRKHYSIELITEYVKSWASQKRKVNEFDQVYLFGKQMQYEYRFLSSGVKNIVTDSPLLLSSIYAEFYFSDISIKSPLDNILAEYEKRFPSLNIFLNRNDKPYSQESRYQTHEEAVYIDNLVKTSLTQKYIEGEDLFFVDYQTPEKILDLVIEKCKP